MTKSSFFALATALYFFGTSAAIEAAPAKKPSDLLQKNSISQSALSPQPIECSIMLSGKEPMSIRDGQRRLTTLGYYNEPLSDEENFEMTRGIRNFQRDSQLEITGELDEPTRTLLIQKTSQSQRLVGTIMLSGKEPMSIRDGQRRLTTLGYYNEPLSDEENFEMTRAIRNFQRDSRLEITGELDEPTRTLLIQKTDPRYQ